MRSEASKKNKKSQDYNKIYFNKIHKEPNKYQIGDYVMVKNLEITIKILKKLISRYKGPY